MKRDKCEKYVNVGAKWKIPFLERGVSIGANWGNVVLRSTCPLVLPKFIVICTHCLTITFLPDVLVNS